jgi:RimJ/RimL family protein N-acetyltransferase
MVTFALASGEEIRFRPVVPDDEPVIADGIRTASRETLLHRFFTPLRGLPPAELRRMLTIDPVREACIVGELTSSTGKRIVCGARYVRLADPSVAEIALTVHDDFQGERIGTFMLDHLIQLGRADGIRTFVADVLVTNTRMLRLLQKIAPKRRSTLADGVCHVEFDLAEVA